jgi:hypothetical protein
LISDVTFAGWLPDSKGLVVLRQLTVTNWHEITRLVPRHETAPVEALVLGLPGLIKGALLAADGDPSAVEEKFFKPLKLEIGPALAAALMCYRDTQPNAFSELFRGIKQADQLKKELVEASTADVQEVSILRLDGNKLAGQPLVLERTLAEIGEPRPSPSAPALAFLRDNVLTVAPLDGSTNRVVVDDKVVGSFDWTADGKSLVFASQLSDRWDQGAINLAHIKQCHVVGTNGALVAADTLLLGTAAFPFMPRVRCLPNRLVLFASQPLQLPQPPTAVTEARFYVIDPAKGTNSAPALISSPDRSGLPADLAAFSLSPDGRYIAIAESGSDAVTIMEVATGRLEVISPNRGARSRTLPAWRGSDELYFAALPDISAKRPEWMHWRKDAKPRGFSIGWPDAAVQNLVEIPKK